MAEICTDTRGADEVKDRELAAVGVHGNEHGHWLSDAAAAANDAYFLGLRGMRLDIWDM